MIDEKGCSVLSVNSDSIDNKISKNDFLPKVFDNSDSTVIVLPVSPESCFSLFMSIDFSSAICLRISSYRFFNVWFTSSVDAFSDL